MTPADIALLVSALRGDRRAASRHAALALRLLDQLDDEVAQTAFAASLHHYYSALESIAERVLRSFEQTIPKGDRWHQDVLELATLDVPDYRPALFSAATLPLLRKSLAFRHFFRHAYAAAWDRVELQHNGETLRALVPLVDADLDQFTAVLLAALERPEG